jgi:hypothetical protein
LAKPGAERHGDQYSDRKNQGGAAPAVGFIKKTQRTPEAESRLARKRMSEFK